MPRVYTIEGGPTANTVALDLFSIIPAANKICSVHAIYIGQTTELGDAQEEQPEVLIVRGGTAATVGSGGAAPTPRPVEPGDGAAGFTARTLDTTKMTFTGGVNMWRDTFNIRNGWQYIPLPEDRIKVHNGNGGLSCALTAAPADSVTWTVCAVIEEIG